MKDLLTILQHPLLNVKALERAVGCPDGTIGVALSPSSPKKIPKKWIGPIISELRKTGEVWAAIEDPA